MRRTTWLAFLLLYIFFGTTALAEMLSVQKHGFVGQYYPPSSESGTQAVIVLGGAEGGIPTKLAEQVAALGYPTLAVAYFKENGLPGELEKIPLAYFDQAKDWLSKKLPVQSEHITLAGWSKGAELALLLASRDTTYNRVVAIAPSSVIWAGILNDWQKVPASSWTAEGAPLPHVAFNPTGPVSGLRDLYTQSLNNRSDHDAATIAVDNIKGQLFLFSGGQDEVWPASPMSESICNSVKSTDAVSCIHYTYPQMGHLLDYTFLQSGTALHARFSDSLAGDQKNVR
ncbi:dienelactone hydrolase [Salinimonas sp. HHU 13199]|uniref:Dienelactone hydrolase n=1 Tax=Salinimonas profundi TaxID=2729140 RepID=A0ABR8LTD3_9ALTE|nr:acyl-CoA thioester hydrolase/BAAT C-terminal domain-containing protein [Salinimonas profundi]MBD3587404.1 dienelactone hydrolase [Salinimonas profundi]